MRVSKALHRAASKSLDGHARFVVRIGHQVCVFSLKDFAHCAKCQIEAAYSCGRCVKGLS